MTSSHEIAELNAGVRHTGDIGALFERGQRALRAEDDQERQRRKELRELVARRRHRVGELVHGALGIALVALGLPDRDRVR
jgi:hypothetical protein